MNDDKNQVPGVSAPVEQTGINHLAMNCIIPGLGTLVRGRTGLGAGQLGLAAAGVFILFHSILLGLLAILAAYVWSIATGVGFVRRQGQMDWQ